MTDTTTADRTADDVYWDAAFATMSVDDLRAFARSMREQYERVSDFHAAAADEVDRLEEELVKVRSEVDSLRSRLAEIVKLAA